MKLGIFLAIGETWEDFIAKGQDALFIEDKLLPYSRKFSQIYVYSYGKKSGTLLPNVELVGNSGQIHRYIYAFLLPFIHRRTVRQLDTVRGMQLTGGIPGITAKLFYRKKIAINYGYDYAMVAGIEKQRIRAFLYRLLEKIMLPFFDIVIVTAPWLVKKIRSVRSHRIRLIPNGVDTELFRPQKHPGTGKVILFIGRLERQKNLPLLISAVGNLVDIKPELLFIGSGSLKIELLNYARELKVNLTIISQVNHNKLPAYYRSARLFVLPSVNEGHPKALLEAMGSGLPVIGTDVPGMKELIREGVNGLLVRSYPAELSSAIRKIWDNKRLAERLGNNARNQVVNSFDSKKLRVAEAELLYKLAYEKK